MSENASVKMLKYSNMLIISLRVLTVENISVWECLGFLSTFILEVV